MGCDLGDPWKSRTFCRKSERLGWCSSALPGVFVSGFSVQCVKGLHGLYPILRDPSAVLEGTGLLLAGPEQLWF